MGDDEQDGTRKSLADVVQVVGSRGFWQLIGLIAAVCTFVSPVALRGWNWLTSKTDQLEAASLSAKVTALHVQQLEQWQSRYEPAQRQQQLADRQAIWDVQHALLTYMAATRRMDVNAVLRDYENNGKLRLWLQAAPECLTPQFAACSDPAAAAERALAQPLPRRR